MRGRGFTLIEIMIAVAIMAIAAYSELTAHRTLGRLFRLEDFQLATRSARTQLHILETAPFAELPPRTVSLPSDRILKLNRFLVADSVKLTRLDGGQDLPVVGRVQAESGTVEVQGVPSATALLVEYEYYLPDRDEAHPVEADGTVTLYNRPVDALLAVNLARGERLTPLGGARLLDATSGKLAVGSELAGRVVVVDYLGGRLRNRVRGTYLNEQLQSVARPSPIKRLELFESYRGPEQMALTVLRVKP